MSRPLLRERRTEKQGDRAVRVREGREGGRGRDQFSPAMRLLFVCPVQGSRKMKNCLYQNRKHGEKYFIQEAVACF